VTSSIGSRFEEAEASHYSHRGCGCTAHTKLGAANILTSSNKTSIRHLWDLSFVTKSSKSPLDSTLEPLPLALSYTIAAFPSPIVSSFWSNLADQVAFSNANIFSGATLMVTKRTSLFRFGRVPATTRSPGQLAFKVNS
jgi:hypothetical protein